MADEYEGMTAAEIAAAEAGAVRSITEIDVPLEPLDEVRETLRIGQGIDPLSALLDASTEAPTEDVPIKRLGVTFTVEAIMDDKVYDRMVDRCTSYVKSRRGGRTREVDGRRLARLTVAEYCVKPAFTAKRGQAEFDALADKFGTREPEDLVDRALLMGEYDLLADKILELSGFDDDVETAGN